MWICLMQEIAKRHLKLHKCKSHDQQKQNKHKSLWSQWSKLTGQSAGCSMVATTMDFYFLYAPSLK